MTRLDDKTEKATSEGLIRDPYTELAVTHTADCPSQRIQGIAVTSKHY